MYFPYLNNKQAEARAISNLATKKKLNNTIPILSTSFIDRDVDWSNSSSVNTYILKRFKFIQSFIDNNQEFILLFDSSISFGQLSIEYIHKCLINGLKLDENIFNSLCTYGINDIDLEEIGNNTFCINREIAIFYQSKPQEHPTFTIKYNILINQNFILDFIQQSFKNKVVITNSFISQASNKQYPAFDEFQTYCLSYKTHNLFAFGDFTVLDPNASTGGGANANNITVAIHLTFFSENSKSIFVAHYLCEPFEEAGISKRVTCALNRLKNDSSRFGETIGLNNLLATETTNLVKLKEHSISHHIEFMNKY